MAVSVSFSVAKMVGLGVASLDAAMVSYILGYTPPRASPVYLAPYNNPPFSTRVDLTAGQPIPAPQDLCDVINQDVTERFGGGVDAVEINGQSYAPRPAP